MFEEPLSEIILCEYSFTNNVLDDFGLDIQENVYRPLNNHLVELDKKEKEAYQEQLAIEELLNEARSIL